MAERKTLTAGPVTTLDQGKEIQRRRKKRKDEMRLKLIIQNKSFPQLLDTANRDNDRK